MQLVPVSEHQLSQSLTLQAPNSDEKRSFLCEKAIQMVFKYWILVNAGLLDHPDHQKCVQTDNYEAFAICIKHGISFVTLPIFCCMGASAGSMM